MKRRTFIKGLLGLVGVSIAPSVLSAIPEAKKPNIEEIYEYAKSLLRREHPLYTLQQNQVQFTVSGLKANDTVAFISSNNKLQSKTSHFGEPLKFGTNEAIHKDNWFVTDGEVKIYYNEASGVKGSTHPIGTEYYPAKSAVQALDILDKLSIPNVAGVYP